MAVTVKREIVEVNSKGQNRSRHQNQMTFTGIMQHNNPYEVDQNSFKQATNVYVDEDKTLISRPPIVGTTYPQGYLEVSGGTVSHWIIPPGNKLIDIYSGGLLILYVSSDDNNVITLVAFNTSSLLVQVLPVNPTEYHISKLHQFIIVFNNVDAYFLDITNYNEGWKLLREHSEVPVTKRIIGQQFTEYPANQFTKSYKEEYVWGPDILPMLPNETTEVVVDQVPHNITWTLLNTNINTEARILRQINIKLLETDFVTTATNTNTGINLIAIGRSDYFMLSIDDGLTFKKILYPYHTGFLSIASLSQDALYYFMVAADGVYRYSIVENTWERIQHSHNDVSKALVGTGYNNMCNFLNGETFAFVLYQEENGLPATRVYWKATNLQFENYPKDTLGFSKLINMSNPLEQRDSTKNDVNLTNIQFVIDEDRTDIILILPGLTEYGKLITTIQSVTNQNLLINTYDYSYRDIVMTRVERATEFPESSLTFNGYTIDGIVTGELVWQEEKFVIGQIDNTNIDPDTESPFGLQPRYQVLNIQDTEIPITDEGAPLPFGNIHLVNYMTYSLDGKAQIADKLNGEDWPSTRVRRKTLVNNNYYIIIVDNDIYTTLMLEDSDAVITYTKIDNTPYQVIPTTSHDNNELYFSVGPKFYITDNIRTSTETLFNLPTINNHYFTSPVNELINISSTEVAIFLENQLYLVVQVPDELLGFRYEYYNSRLSAGVRQGDAVINTIDGQFTIYPARQGLAIMQYQAQTATTDQAIEYLTNNIPKLWREFYDAGNIKMVQQKDYIYLSNGTKQYIMLDLRNMSWWRFESPVPVNKIVISNYDTYFISNGLYQYNNNHSRYYDLLNTPIIWNTQSQPLHFGLPNHYKSIRQLIFQFEESTKLNQTLVVQVSLYRKSLTIRAPEIINFDVDAYRTFIKRFNYWKINELQWAIGNDVNTVTPAQLKLNGMSIKFEIGEEVRT